MHAVRWKGVLLLTLSLQVQLNPCKSNCGPGQCEHIQCLHNTIWAPDLQRLQAQIKYYGKTSYKKHQDVSYKMIASCNWWSPTTIASTRPSVQSKLARILSLQLWLQQTATSHSSCRIDWHHKFNPSKSAYEILNGPYNWNRYPLAPLGCKTIVYKDGNTCGSWASRGVNVWYLGPSKDHYQCDNYYIIETRAYQISGSTELFPQHFQLRDMTSHQHLKALTDILADATAIASGTPKGKRLFQALGQKIEDLLHPLPAQEEQRVANEMWLLIQEEEQRVIDDTPIITIPRLTNLPTIMKTRNPTAKQVLKVTKRLHRQDTRNNTPAIMPVPNINRYMNTSAPLMLRGSTQTNPRPRTLPPGAHNRIVATSNQRPYLTRKSILQYSPHPRRAHETRQNDNTLWTLCKTIGTSSNRRKHSSYKRLINNPVTAEVCQVAFRHDFGGMAPGDIKTGQKGTNAMFVMNHDEIAHAFATKKFFTYGNPVFNYRPQKKFPHCIRITAGGNLINYECSNLCKLWTWIQQKTIGTAW